MGVIRFPLRVIPASTAGARYETARQQMLNAFLAWLQQEPQAVEVGPEEVASIASAMRQIHEIVRDGGQING